MDVDQPSNSEIRYSLEYDSLTLPFTLDPITGELWTMRPFDLEGESEGEYKLRVVAYNTVPYDGRVENQTTSVLVSIRVSGSDATAVLYFLANTCT